MYYPLLLTSDNKGFKLSALEKRASPRFKSIFYVKETECERFFN